MLFTLLEIESTLDCRYSVCGRVMLAWSHASLFDCRYSVCGRVVVTSVGIETGGRPLEVYKRPHLAVESEKPSTTASTDLQGTFCFMLSPGEYAIQVCKLFCQVRSGVLADIDWE